MTDLVPVQLPEFNNETYLVPPRVKEYIERKIEFHRLTLNYVRDANREMERLRNEIRNLQLQKQLLERLVNFAEEGRRLQAQFNI